MAKKICRTSSRGFQFGKNCLATAAVMLAVASFPAYADDAATTGAASFAGEKTSWHGFDRYDFLLDEKTQAITPIKAQDDEKDGIRHNIEGQRRCIIVVPKTAAAGNPWSWRGCYWDHQPQTEVALLKRGFCIGYIESGPILRPGQSWETWYDFLTTKHGMSHKPAFVGMSRGGEFAYTWGVMHPDEVSCIYADNPGGSMQIMLKLGTLATNDVPVFHVCGSIDPLLSRVTLPMENIYQQFGGRISIMIKEGRGHHPHSLRDPQIVADWIEQSVKATPPAAPAFAGHKFTHAYFYSAENSYRDFPKEGTYIACRGPAFTNCYDRYSFDLPGVEGTITVTEPLTPAPGNPWIFRADFLNRDANVDLALLAKGFYIVTGPVPYNFDGPQIASWNKVYDHLTAAGFSKKPVMEGAGAAAGETCAWAIENPDKVSCLYVLNPSFRSNLAKTQPIDNLSPLAKANVPFLIVAGSLDPFLAGNTRVVEQRYKELGGNASVIIEDGAGHFPNAPKDPNAVVDFITQHVN